MNVYEIQREFTQILDLLATIADMELAGEDVTQFKADTMEYYDSLEGTLQDKMDNIGRLLCNLESEKAAKKTEAARLTDRVKALDNRIATIKETLIKPTLIATKTQKVNGDLFTMSLRKSDSVVISDEAKIPAKYKTTKSEVTISKADIKKAFKNEESVPGASIVTNQSVQIK